MTVGKKKYEFIRRQPFPEILQYLKTIVIRLFLKHILILTYSFSQQF